MSLQHAAQHLASKGRGPDTELIHMSKNEIAGLQALAQAHGKSLTINPHTGLPEAGVLDKLMPAILGGASMYFTGSPYAGMALSGLMGYQEGGLKGGLMNALGAYGGGQLAAGLGASAAAAPGAATSGASNALTSGAATSPGSVPVTDLGVGASQAPVVPGGVLAQGNVVATPIQAPVDSYIGADFEQMSGYMPEVTTLNHPIVPSAMDTVAANASKANLLMAGAPVLSGMIDDSQKPTTTSTVSAKGDTDLGPRYAYEPGYSNVTRTRTGPAKYRTLTSDEAKKMYGFAKGGMTASEAEMRKLEAHKQMMREALAQKYADGGMTYGDGDVQGDPNLMQVKTFDPVVRMNTGGATDTEAMLKSLAAQAPKKPTVAEKEQPKTLGLSDIAGLRSAKSYTDMPGLFAAGGGISTLGGYSDGGRLLKGPGDGVSDSIPAVIGNKQPARLADGEFVIPARIVSELGNGSTDAGARQLYKMMDRIQKARSKTTGKAKVAQDTKAAKYLPA